VLVPPITYVRHAMPVVEEGIDPCEWHLDDATRAQVTAWADRLEVGEGIGALVASTEPKALETAAAIAARWPAEVVGDHRLREAERPWVGTASRYRTVAHQYLRGERPDGWEAHDHVAARVGAAVDDACAAADGRAVVVVFHGLALSLHLGHRLGAGFDREAFWSRLAFPDAWTLDDGVLHRPVPTPA
jgi:broad specificity phosphatase PhoE